MLEVMGAREPGSCSPSPAVLPLGLLAGDDKDEEGAVGRAKSSQRFRCVWLGLPQGLLACLLGGKDLT